MWHGSAHIMAEALEFFYPGIKLAIGPPIENGFYYDVDFGEYEFTDKDLAKVEKKCGTSQRKKPICKRRCKQKEALKFFNTKRRSLQIRVNRRIRRWDHHILFSR